MRTPASRSVPGDESRVAERARGPRGPVADEGYWVDLFQAGQRLGAGFLLNRCFVLTALHCLRHLDASTGEVVIALADARRVRGRVCRTADEADLALIEIDASHEIALPVPSAHIAARGDKWRGPYRPSPGDVQLSGSIDHGAMLYTCVAGASIEALQLTADQRLGDYSGYSGGPVEGGEADADPVVLGILLEQAMDRHSTELRAANVLFAATIAEALRRFDHFDVGHLIDVLRPPAHPAHPVRHGPLPTGQDGRLPSRGEPLPSANGPLPATTNDPLLAATNGPLPATTNDPLLAATNGPLPPARNGPHPAAHNGRPPAPAHPAAGQEQDAAQLPATAPVLAPGGEPGTHPDAAPGPGPAADTPPVVPPPPSGPVTRTGLEPVAEAETLLVALRQWAENGLIDPTEAAAHRVEVLRRLIEGKLGEGARDAHD
ncbi:trypsin-like serine protease [Streptomyces iconiensis]|uniref:Peptidase S1 domain-containing protein n=1 Tax=Streptomyces iconiensis TaxID=1384038 RepID=A0ABT6ZQ58_9ACTN|nr:trypsin-like serine protease [Streptomyces iconiensis]MDJ1131197.1 hypothetical protein [Streptomyces iconiensis]